MPVAVDEHLVAVAGDDRWPEQHAHDVEELGVLDAIEVLDPLLDLLLAAARVDDDERDEQRDDDRDEYGHDEGLRAEALAQPGEPRSPAARGGGPVHG